LVLRYGEILYNGTVNGMIAHDGYFELIAEDNSQLTAALKTHPNIDAIAESEGKVTAQFTQKIDPGTLNRYLFDRGICLQHLVLKKQSLEEQFLTLTNK
jgi:ABC-2 type transport system ATP-binding protein